MMAANGKQTSGDLGSFKSQVLSSIDIVELIGRSVTLKRAGKDFKGLCPFHQEKTPSFFVNPSKQTFGCYGCKKFGNAIDFVIERDRVEFIDALRMLGESLGLEMPRRGAGGGPKPGEKQLLYEMQSAAGAFFSRTLEEPRVGQAARDYLVKRGFNDESIKRFQIGLAAEGWDNLLKGAVGRKYLPDQLVLGGLLKKRDNGSGFYDVFRNRLMFPIRDDSGRVIAFGGREMPGAENPPKYLNSPDTPLFTKNRCLFGLDLAKQKIVETRTAVVVEGYTDVVMAHQYGASNVVATLGTALSENHVNLLKRFADRIVLLFDADAAGDTAVDRALGLFLTQKVNIAVASMPEGVDPDEFLLEHGVGGFDGVIAAAVDALVYKWKQLQRKFNASGDSLTGQQKTVEEYLNLLAGARESGPVDSIRWGLALAQVAKLTDIPVEQLNRRFQTKKPDKRGPQGANARTGNENGDWPANGKISDDGADNPAQAAQSGQPTSVEPVLPVRRQLSAQESAERRLLGVLLLEPGRWPEVQKQVSLADFSDEMHHKLAEIYWSHQQDEGEPVFNEFLGLLTDKNLRELAVTAVQEAETLSDLGGLVEQSLGFFEERRQLAAAQKLLHEVQRTNSGQAEDVLKKLQDRARQPNLRRI